MATATTTTKETTVKKSVEDTKIKKENTELKKQLKEQSEMIKQQAEMMKQLQQQMLSLSQSQPQVQESKSLNSKKIKIYSMLPNTYYLHTKEDGSGTTIKFTKFGEMRNVKFDDLEAIVSLYPRQAENGWFYISDKDAIKELGLEEEYNSIFSLNTMKNIVNLKEQENVDMIKNLDNEYYEYLSDLIADNINSGYKYDYNYLKQASDIMGIDIEKIAKNKNKLNIK